MNTLLVIANFVLAALNVVFSVVLAGDSNIAGRPELIGYVFGGALFFPLLVVGMTALSSENRNSRSLLKAFFWTSVVVLVVSLSRVGALVAPQQLGGV